MIGTLKKIFAGISELHVMKTAGYPFVDYADSSALTSAVSAKKHLDVMYIVLEAL